MLIILIYFNSFILNIFPLIVFLILFVSIRNRLVVTFGRQFHHVSRLSIPLLRSPSVVDLAEFDLGERKFGMCESFLALEKGTNTQVVIHTFKSLSSFSRRISLRAQLGIPGVLRLLGFGIDSATKHGF
jgi:hypothetical protein